MTLRANTLTTAMTGCLIAVCLAGSRLMADDATLVIDDRSSGGYSTSAGSDWRLVTDTVMGVSRMDN